jgi:hypothetical protein
LPGLIEDLPIFRVQVELATDFKQTRAWDANTKLSTDGSVITAMIEEIHEVLIIDY